MPDQIEDMLKDFEPGELHTNLEEIGQDSLINSNKMDMFLKLLDAGVPMDQIPINDMDALIKMFNAHQEPNKTVSSPIDRFARLANLSEILDIKGHIDLADDIEKFSNIILSYELSQPKYAFIPELDEEMSVSHLAGEPEQLPQQLPQESLQGNLLEPEISDEDLEETVTPKDIDNLLNKLEALMDVMGEDFDPDIVPIARKILQEILEKFEQVGEIASSDDSIEQVSEEIPNIQETPTSSVMDLNREANLVGRMDKVSSLINSGLETGDSDWFLPNGQKLEIDVPNDMTPDHWGKGRAFIPQMKEMGFQEPESDSFTDVVENLLKQKFLRKTTGYGRLTYTLGDQSLLSKVENDIWDEVISANKTGRNGIENVMVDILVQDLSNENPDDMSVVSFSIKEFIESGQNLSEFYQTISPSDINSWVNQFSRKAMVVHTGQQLPNLTTPAIASIIHSTIKIAQIAEDLEHIPYQQSLIDDIDGLILDINELVEKL